MMVCGKCKAPTDSVAEVKACHAGKREPCHWMVEKGWTEDGERVIVDCGAHVTFTDRGWSCEAGHDYVSIEARHAERWDYAHDSIEAAAMAKAGVDAVGMDGGAVPIYVGV